jgi:predicted metal-dependent enzyme (double-stranded beta helix superfamily)
MRTVREFAAATQALLADAGDDWNAVEAGLGELMREWVRRPDLLTLGVPREGNHVRESQYLYYDGELAITVSHQGRGVTIPPHDHGTWEAVAVYRGRITHTRYGGVGEVADASADAALEILEERVMEAGDTIVVVPPDDIHSFTALSEDTYHLAVVGGRYSPVRRYFQPDDHSYIYRAETSWRRR